jgi:hypothetical protein
MFFLELAMLVLRSDFVKKIFNMGNKTVMTLSQSRA